MQASQPDELTIDEQEMLEVIEDGDMEDWVKVHKYYPASVFFFFGLTLLYDFMVIVLLSCSRVFNYYFMHFFHF